MGKHYELIAYNYDKFNRINKFVDQMAIKIPGVEFNSIQDIDRFTASMSKLDFASSVRDIVGPRNNFSIRINDDEGHSFYNKIIFNNSELVKIIDSLEKRSLRTTLGYKTYNLINGRSDYFSEQFSIIEKALENRDVAYFNTIFNDRSDLGFLLLRFANSPYDEAYNSGTLDDIELAFRNYETFRKFVVSYDKDKHYNFNVENSKIQDENVYIEEKDYKTKGSSLKTVTATGNYQSEREPYKNPYVVEEKEEFLDDDELYEMSGFDDEAEPIYYTGRKL